jgi:hypothetical protein
MRRAHRMRAAQRTALTSHLPCPRLPSEAGDSRISVSAIREGKGRA